MEHPDINRIERFGYPEKEYLDFEEKSERESGFDEGDLETD